jgi:O-acetyl-ADP-ribose deacetylase (regulator of RNase III)
MTVVHREGNVFNSEMPAIGHGVNIEGVMGSGIAKTVRELYPSVYKKYRTACLTTDRLKGGGHLPLLALEHITSERWIMNIASQEKQGRNAQYPFMESALTKAFNWVSNMGLVGLALPKIGSDIGGLEWENVLTIIENQAKLHPDLIVEAWTFNPNM